MIPLRYPIGIQTFSEIIEKGYVYIDKTRYISDLTSHGKYVFLSRPRRFGKSLLLSTLRAYFEGRRELFKGLAIDRMDVDWTPSPILHFDFTSENYKEEEGLDNRLNTILKRYEQEYGRDPEFVTPAQRFSHLIDAVHRKTGRQVVILVDEYDKPLLDIEDNPDLFDKNQRILKSVYGNFKSMDGHIRYAFITGVARFSKVSIFSDLNNLDDISMEDTYADICGWTEEELLAGFQPGIKTLSEKRKETFEETLEALRTYYDGYLFTPAGSRLYNPYSVLRAMKAKKISPFWFDSGSPTFLVRRIKKRGTYPPDLNGQKCHESDLMSVGLDDSNPVPLMFQTGYLTIGHADEETGRYQLRFPNREVELGFYKQLLPMYVPSIDNSDSRFDFFKFQDDLIDGRPEDFMKRLSTLMKDLPGEDHCESAYRAITYLLTVLCGASAIAERHSYQGRSDIEVEVGGNIYIFEFKYNRSVGEAMAQIRERDYAGRYAMDHRTIYLIGANFNEKKEARGLKYEIELLNTSGAENFL